MSQTKIYMSQTKFPVKYIENNLVMNTERECFAYYEMVPYNYSFLSVDQTIIRFCRWIRKTGFMMSSGSSWLLIRADACIF